MSEVYEPKISEAKFVLQMVEKYRELLLACAGLKSVTIDGQAVTYEQLEQQYAHWHKKLGRINGTRPRVASITLENA